MLITQAQEEYQAHDPYWSASLVAELESKQPGLALSWAIECMEALLENIDLPTKEKQLGWLAKLSAARANANSSDLLEKSNQVWHEERDLIHIAMSHLYAALAYSSQQNDVRYRTRIIWALGVMGDHDFYKRTSVAIPLSLFERFTVNEE